MSVVLHDGRCAFLRRREMQECPCTWPVAEQRMRLDQWNRRLVERKSGAVDPNGEARDHRGRHRDDERGPDETRAGHGDECPTADRSTSAHPPEESRTERDGGQNHTSRQSEYGPEQSPTR